MTTESQRHFSLSLDLCRGWTDSPADMNRLPSAREHVVVTLLLLATLLVTGCGGGGPTTASNRTASNSAAVSSGAAIESSELHLIDAAGAICERLNAEIVKSSNRVDVAEIVHVAPRNAVLERRAVAELARLTPPAALAHDWHQLLAYRRTLAQQLVTLVGYARRNDSHALDTLIAAKERLRGQLRVTAASLGLQDCGAIG
jgi:hypothetical protein